MYGSTVDYSESLTIVDAQRVAEFRGALRRFQARTDLAARAAGLTPQRYLLLVTIKGAPDGTQRATVSELSDRLLMPQTTISDLVSRAEEVGLLRRAQSTKDGRVVDVCLTPEGERRLAKCIGSLEGDRLELGQALAIASRRMRSLTRAG
jgi:DNA-binding MarR family transcriptional regulator